MHRLNDLFYLFLFNLLDALCLPLGLWRRLFGRRPAWPPKRILVLHTEGIGDLVMATPLLAALRCEWPTAELVLAVQPHPGKSTLLDGTGCVDRTVEIPDADGLRAIRDRAFWRELGEPPFDLVVQCYPFTRRWKLAFLWLLVRFGCPGASMRHRTSDFLNWSGWIRYYAPPPGKQHRVKSNLAVAAKMGIERPATVRTFVGRTETDREFADRFLREHGLDNAFPRVGIHPGSLAARAFKRWPSEKHVELIQRLHKTFGCRFILFQGPDDEEAIRALADVSAEVGAVIVAESTLNQVAAIIARCDLMISTDAALGHVAAAVGVPTVAIFGPGDPVQVRPWGETVQVVRREDLCAACMQLWRPLKCRYDFRCIREVSVEAVFEAAGEIIHAAPLPNPRRDRRN